MPEPDPTAPVGVPNPAADRPGAAPTATDAEPLSRPARTALSLAERLPDWAGSVRFRLTALYSLVLFALAAFLVAGLYAILAARLSDERVYQTYQVTTVERVPGGVTLTPTEVQASYRSVEALANERALNLLRSYSLTALVILFFASMLVGWLVAGRVLAPIGRITGVAREIQATDLSRRIALGGPPDELRELADTFDAMLSRLDDAFEGQQRFIQEASHELRNPLAVMRTNLEVALGDPDVDAAELRRVAELVEASAERMSTLVDDLLVYARLGAPARELHPVALAALARDAADELAATAAGRSLRLDVEDLGAPAVVGDPLALRQAVANLLVNAVRLAPEGTTIWVRTGADDRGAWVTVADEGPGISEEDRPHVFERFWRGDKGAARAEGRSGLGLAIVAQVAADHGGSAHVDPNERGGSTFTVRLPPAGDSQEPLS